MRVSAEELQFGEVLGSIETMIGCKAKKTQEAYWYSLEYLADFLRVKLHSYAFERALLTFTPASAMKFIGHLKRVRTKEGGFFSDNTISLRAAVLRKVFAHLIDIGARTGNPIAVVRDAIPYRQKKQKRPTKLIPFDVVRKFLDLPDETTKKGIRDRALLALLFGGGLRRSEALNLNIGDIDQTPEGTPFLVLQRTKAGQAQQQSLPSWAWSRLLKYLNQRDADGDGDGPERPLFVFYYEDGSQGGRLSDSTIARVYKRYAIDAGIPGAAPHSARATAVTMLKELGVEDRDVARFLRHTTTKQVEVYDKRGRGPATNPGRKLVYISNPSDLEKGTQN